MRLKNMRIKPGITVKGCMKILLNTQGFDYDFKQICDLVLPTAEREFFLIDKTPQVAAFLLVSELKDCHFGKRSYPTKQQLKKRLNLSPTSALWSITSDGSHERILEFKKKLRNWYEIARLKYLVNF